jgi:hypothetical protein
MHGIIVYAAAIAGMSIAAAIKITRHYESKKHLQASAVLVLAGAIAGTFSAIYWFAGFFRATSSGWGFVLLVTIGLGWSGTELFIHVVNGHERLSRSTLWKAALPAGVAIMTLIVNFSAIKQSVQADLTGHNYTQVVDSVHKGGH